MWPKTEGMNSESWAADLATAAVVFMAADLEVATAERGHRRYRVGAESPAVKSRHLLH